jgi:hypothetical protein
MVCGFFFSPVIAFTGHLIAQRVQPTHLSLSIEYVRRSEHAFAGHFLSFI